MPNQHETSEAEEMYLITVARAIEDGTGPPVPVSAIAGALEVSSVSANQMIKKLEGAGLLGYVPYKGVTLTAAGDELANTVLRSRRLWGRFLADNLGLSAAKADEVACEMEHVTPSMVADRLASFLGDPTTGPTGKPIPRGSSKPEAVLAVLADISVGTAVTVVETRSDHAEFLNSQGVGEGADIRVVGLGGDGSVLVEGLAGPVHIAASIAAEISVR